MDAPPVLRRATQIAGSIAKGIRAETGITPAELKSGDAFRLVWSDQTHWLLQTSKTARKAHGADQVSVHVSFEEAAGARSSGSVSGAPVLRVTVVHSAARLEQGAAGDSRPGPARHAAGTEKCCESASASAPHANRQVDRFAASGSTSSDDACMTDDEFAYAFHGKHASNYVPRRDAQGHATDILASTLIDDLVSVSLSFLLHPDRKFHRPGTSLSVNLTPPVALQGQIAGTTAFAGAASYVRQCLSTWHPNAAVSVTTTPEQHTTDVKPVRLVVVDEAALARVPEELKVRQTEAKFRSLRKGFLSQAGVLADPRSEAASGSEAAPRPKEIAQLRGCTSEAPEVSAAALFERNRLEQHASPDADCVKLLSRPLGFGCAVEPAAAAPQEDATAEADATDNGEGMRDLASRLFPREEGELTGPELLERARLAKDSTVEEEKENSAVANQPLVADIGAAGDDVLASWMKRRI